MIDAAAASRSPWAVFVVFLRLGLTSFGGPIAHLAYFRAEFVTRRGWLTESAYADLVALCQFLPGPASSQVGMALGLSRAGYAGALAAWAGFTLPSAAAMVLLGLGLASDAVRAPAGLLQGLKIVAVAVVAQAVWGMARTLCADIRRVSIMTGACCATLLTPTVWGQVLTILTAAAAGLMLCSRMPVAAEEGVENRVSRRAGALWLALFFGLLLGLPLLAALVPGRALAMVEAFYRAGSLVFGGGHVVLPLLQAEVVPAGWVGNEAFLAGYGAAQALPGPLFTFAAFLGAAMVGAPSGLAGGLICLLAIFMPSFLLVAGSLPFWAHLRRSAHAQAALAGINAAVVGLLLAALYHPVWTTAVHRPADFALVLVAFVALMFWKLPPWLVVAACGVGGGLLLGAS